MNGHRVPIVDVYSGGSSEQDEDEEEDEYATTSNESAFVGHGQAGPSGTRKRSYREGDEYYDDDEDEDDEQNTLRDDMYSSQQYSDQWDAQADIDSNVRHGFAEAYSSDEYLKALEKNYFLYWTEPRHERAGRPKPPSDDPADQKIDWRNRDRIRTAAAVLVVCLRIGYDPPDIVKTDPCAKLECWVDPYALAKDKAMERIGRNLQQQFESLAAAPKTRYKQFLDPPVEDAKKFCTAARKSAKGERVLFYYNGHGVPKPTPSGEIWLFNKQYTQYIPVSLAEIVSWLGSPCIMIWDCSAAGNIVTKVQEFALKRDAELAKEANATRKEGEPRPSISARDTIQLGACLSHEQLPMNPDLPADLFTCCLTSPIEIALRFFALRNPLKRDLDLDMLLKIPGKLNDRRTPLGELTWIFTAVTDTIAWNTLPRPLFQKLFRHDLVVAALFRGFLLAERIMRFYECTPVSVPALPQTHNHPLWDSWDLAVDMCLAQLPALLEHEERWKASLPPQPPMLPDQTPNLPVGPPLPYVHSSFFAEQLTAFEIWLEQGKVGKRSHPEQLPVVLQVLLSQAHRLKALILLCKFLDLGPWAVNVALSIGIFAYVLRLLQAPAVELKPVLIYIWARILAVYENCKEDLLKQTFPPTRAVDQAPYQYFVSILLPSAQPLPIPNVSEHRAMCAFILSVCCRDHKPGQVACLRSGVFDACLVHLRDPDPLLRQWSALCIAQMWNDFEEAKGLGVRARVHELLCEILHADEVPEVRASVMYALGTLLGTTGSPNPNKRAGRSIICSGSASGLSASEQTDVELGVAMSTLKCASDGSPMIRRELVVLLSSVVNEHQGQFAIAAYRSLVERASSKKANEHHSTLTNQTKEAFETLVADIYAATESEDGPSSSVFRLTLFACMYKTIVELATDPCPSVSAHAAAVLDYVFAVLLASPLGPNARKLIEEGGLPGRSQATNVATARGPLEAGKVARDGLYADSPSSTVSSKQSSSQGVASGPMSTLKRTASLASAMKSLAQLTTTGLSDNSHSANQQQQQSQPQSTANPPPSALRTSNGPRTGGSTPSPTTLASPVSFHTSASTDSLRYLQSKVGKITPKTNKPAAQSQSAQSQQGKVMPNETQQPRTLDVESIMIDMIANDEERLKRRRAMPTIPSSTSASGTSTPANGLSSSSNGNGGADMLAASAQSASSSTTWAAHDGSEDVLPLKGEFYDFALDYYRESQMRQQQEADEPGSEQHNERLWRRARNESIIIKTQPMKGPACRARWDEQIGFLTNDAPPTRILFHQFESHLLSADEAGHISVYDWEHSHKLNRFANGSPPSVRISSMRFVNEDDIAMLLTGSADGHIRLFRDYDSPDKVELVSAFQGIPETIPTTTPRHDAGLVVEWQQGRGHVLMGGNVKYVRVWDATNETIVHDLPTRANSCLTNLTCDQVAGNILVGGFGDGSIKVYDRRLPPRDNMVRNYKGHHNAWILNVHMQRGGNRELVSASLAGDVCTWDIRLNEPIRTMQAHQGGMTQMAVHEHAPIFATTSAYNVVKVWNVNDDADEPISKFRNSFGYMGSKPTAMTGLTFHPHHMLLGCSSNDGHVNLFQMEDYLRAMDRVTATLSPLGYAPRTTSYSGM